MIYKITQWPGQDLLGLSHDVSDCRGCKLGSVYHQGAAVKYCDDKRLSILMTCRDCYCHSDCKNSSFVGVACRGNFDSSWQIINRKQSRSWRARHGIDNLWFTFDWTDGASDRNQLICLTYLMVLVYDRIDHWSVLTRTLDSNVYFKDYWTLCWIGLWCHLNS